MVPKFFLIKDGKSYQFATNYVEPNLAHFARHGDKLKPESRSLPKSKNTFEKLFYILKLNAHRLLQVMDYPILQDIPNFLKLMLIILLILSPILFVALCLWLLSEGLKPKKPFNLRLDPKVDEGRNRSPVSPNSEVKKNKEEKKSTIDPSEKPKEA